MNWELGKLIYSRQVRKERRFPNNTPQNVLKFWMNQRGEKNKVVTSQNADQPPKEATVLVNGCSKYELCAEIGSISFGEESRYTFLLDILKFCASNKIRIHCTKCAEKH